MNTPGGNQCYGLIFEFLNPEAVAPGLVGAISLLVALYARPNRAHFDTVTR
jgi:hypothetical protein